METQFPSSSSPNDVRNFGKRQTCNTKERFPGDRTSSEFGNSPRSPGWLESRNQAEHQYESVTQDTSPIPYDSAQGRNSRLSSAGLICSGVGNQNVGDTSDKIDSMEAMNYTQNTSENPGRPASSNYPKQVHNDTLVHQQMQHDSGGDFFGHRHHGQHGDSCHGNNYGMPPAAGNYETEPFSSNTADRTDYHRSSTMYTPSRLSPPGPPAMIMTTAPHAPYYPHPVSVAPYSYGQHPPPFVQYPYYPPGPHHMMPVQPQREYIRDINQNDVLCGRGGATNSHPGNRNYRSIVKQYQDRYLRAKKRDKPEVASLVVEHIRQQGGRFLKREQGVDNGEILWYDIGRSGAREKTCQALREGAPALKRRKRREERHDHRELKRTETEDTVSITSSVDRPGTALTDCRNSTRRPFRFNDAKEDFQDYHDSSHVGEGGPIGFDPVTRKAIETDARIDVTELSREDRDLYNRDFLPPNPVSDSPRRCFVSITPNAHFSPAPSFTDDEAEEEDTTKAVAV